MISTESPRNPIELSRRPDSPGDLQDADAWLAPILEMVGQGAPRTDILETLAARCGEPVAFFVAEGGGWKIAAKSRDFPEGLYISLELARLSAALSENGVPCLAAPAPEPGAPCCELGWARRLDSATGELEGAAVGLGPASDLGHIESICLAARLAIEQGSKAKPPLGTGAEPAQAIPGQTAEPWNGASSTGYRELSMQRIARMIARRSEPAQILEALCLHAGEWQGDQQLAFFLTNGEEWTLAARGPLTAENERRLASTRPAAISEAIFAQAGMADPAEFPFEFGWARHLLSGTGELLGMLMALGDGPNIPCGERGLYIESICSLAALAIEQHHLIADLVFKAEHDALTGFFNREYYERALSETLQRARWKGQRPALIYLNLDRFRMVNDVLGHATGDRLVAAIAARLESAVRHADLLARISGDEFVVLIEDVTAIEDAGALGERMARLFDEAYSVDGHELYIRASIGVGWAGAESTAKSLEREAYLALQHARHAGGKSRIAYYSPSLAATPPERLEREKRLRFALAKKELLVYYQPQVAVATGKMVGCEALIRWRSADVGMVSPAAFVPILEESGMIIEFGRWVLMESCRQGVEWIERYGRRLRMSVNVSAAQLTHPGFVQDVQTTLLDTGFPAELLELELTESSLVDDFAAAEHIFRALKASGGVTFALDDFGIGQSSLSYLHRLPFRRLKIDQAFVRRIREGCKPEPLLESILRMASDLGMEAIAEGVETVDQLRLLRRLGCPEAQGFLFAQPLPPVEFAELFERESFLDLLGA
jgi:diguanylate cyclase (GGDEF)-like protein